MKTIIVTPPAFRMGQMLVTANAQSTLTAEEIASGISRHSQKDWGDVPPEDAKSNDLALTKGGRIVSAYGQGPSRFWIITEADRSVTTVLLPQDY